MELGRSLCWKWEGGRQWVGYLTMDQQLMIYFQWNVTIGRAVNHVSKEERKPQVMKKQRKHWKREENKRNWWTSKSKRYKSEFQRTSQKTINMWCHWLSLSSRPQGSLIHDPLNASGFGHSPRLSCPLLTHSHLHPQNPISQYLNWNMILKKKCVYWNSISKGRNDNTHFIW